ncbi:hypothetical protein DPV78_001129 [Talaromyces pinophilus]|nr:hypothetical protein DPV78_001129 [Talaromyces pinophilus]
MSNQMSGLVRSPSLLNERADDEGGMASEHAPEQQADVQHAPQDRVDEGEGGGVELMDEEDGLVDEVGWEGA